MGTYTLGIPWKDWNPSNPYHTRPIRQRSAKSPPFQGGVAGAAPAWAIYIKWGYGEDGGSQKSVKLSANNPRRFESFYPHLTIEPKCSKFKMFKFCWYILLRRETSLWRPLLKVWIWTLNCLAVCWGSAEIGTNFIGTILNCQSDGWAELMTG